VRAPADKEAVEALTPIDTGGVFPLVDLHLSARALKNVGDGSNVFCVLFVKNYTTRNWVEFTRTEARPNAREVHWVRYFRVKYVFAVRQRLQIRVYEEFGTSGELTRHHEIGRVKFRTSEVYNGTGRTELILKLDNQGKGIGNLLIDSEKVPDCASIVRVKFTATGLKRMHFLQRNEPFFTFAKAMEHGNWGNVYQSKRSASGDWDELQVPAQILYGLDKEKPLRVTVWDWNNGSPLEIGHADTSFDRLLERPPLELVAGEMEHRGDLTAVTVALEEHPTFSDYRNAGWRLALMAGIDFTTSNGDINDSRSLHYIRGPAPNAYEQCIRAVGSILCPYTDGHRGFVRGFGGEINGDPNDCFPLTDEPFVRDPQGLLSAYGQAIRRVKLSGPSNLAPVIRWATGEAERQDEKTYSILLIMTDGEIADEQPTIDAIVDASTKRLSIVIVGLGDRDFTLLERLDADQCPLESDEGVAVSRDIVQFVAFKNFPPTREGAAALASEVLAEIPTQFIEWARQRGMRP
jgi:hypothetical protein